MGFGGGGGGGCVLVGHLNASGVAKRRDRPTSGPNVTNVKKKKR